MLSLGHRIRELRLKKGITQTEIAQGVCTPSMISQIESDRANPSYKVLYAIAEKLDVPLDTLLSDVDLQLEYISQYKMSRSMIASREYASALPLLQELLKAPRGQLSYSELLFDLGECYLHVGQLEEAEQSFTTLQEIAVLHKDAHLQTLLLNHLAHIQFQRKHYQLAIHQWQKAQEEVERIQPPAPRLKATILLHLGQVNQSLGHIQESISAYQQAAELLHEADAPADLGTAYLGLSISCRKLGALEQAADYAERAATLFEKLDQFLLALQTQVSKASLLACTDRVEEALAILEGAISTFRDLGNPEQEGIALVELAKVKVQTGKLETAEELCYRARNLLPELHLYQGWINRVSGKIALLRHQRQAALRRFHKAADCFKHMEEVSEWDATMYEISRLYLEESDFERAFRVLDDIRSTRRRILETRGIDL